MYIRAAVVEDNEKSRNQLIHFLKVFQDRNKIVVHIRDFSDGSELMKDFTLDYDIIFLDIEMPELNGMEAARQIRRVDEKVMLVFITNIARYAIHGYEVGAVDFILKPVTYSAFQMKLQRLMRQLAQEKERKLTLNINDELYKVSVSEISYVEVQNHHLLYHLPDQVLKVRGSMKEAVKSLEECNFVQCNSCYLVNLHEVQAVEENEVLVNGEYLQISRSKKKAFVQALADYLGGN